MATTEKTIEMSNRLKSVKNSDNPEVNHIIAGADDIYDDDKGKKQSLINAETDATLAEHTSTINGLNSQNYVTITATDQTSDVTDVLPEEGSVDTVYRVGNWDGTQYDETAYSEYSWNGSTYVHISTKTQIGEVFDISAYHASGGTLATYDELTDALGTNGANVPQSLRKGGMSIKFVHTYDNKYVQFRYMLEYANTPAGNAAFVNVANWQGVDDEPTAGSNNLVKSGGVLTWGEENYGTYVENPEFIEVRTDSEGKILWGIKFDGSVYFGFGVPPQIVDYIQKKIEELSLDEYEDIVTFLNGLEEGENTLQQLLNEKLDAEGLETSALKMLDVVENPEWVKVVVDANNKIVYGIKNDGEFYFGIGVPQQIKDYIVANTNEILAVVRNDVINNIRDINTEENIVHRSFYANQSADISVTVDVSTRKNNYVWVDVFCSDFLTVYDYSKTYNVKDNDGNVLYSAQKVNQPRKIEIPDEVDRVVIETTNITSQDLLDLSVNVWNKYDGITFVVAASDATPYFKKVAHFICDGVNDEQELTEASSIGGMSHSLIIMSNGKFVVDEFKEKTIKSNTQYGIIINTPFGDLARNLTIKAQGKYANSYDKGTQIYVRESAFDNVPNNVEPFVIGGPKFQQSSGIEISGLRIRIEDNQHKVVVVNGQYLRFLSIDDCSFAAGDNAWSSTLPVEGCIGVRGVCGDCNNNYYLAHSNTIAFYEGWQLGGEHLVMIDCGGRFNYYCYSFGNYDYGSFLNEGAVTDSHPLTLINCCDEGSRALPKFAKSGMYYLNNQAAKQQIVMVGFNMEVHTSELQGAVELVPGAFCGHIDFVAYGNSNSSKNTPTPERGSRVDVKFWANDDSGKYFETINSAHAKSGSTQERLGYWAQHNQIYYDTDLNKMLVCTDSVNQTWRDFNGNIIN